MTAEATLSHAAGRAVYDRIGVWQDTQRFYEDGATSEMIGVDRFVSTYVLDLLSAADIALVLDEAHRVLSTDGLACLVSATHGRPPLEHLVMRIAGAAHSLSPALVGGCRAIDLRGFLGPTRWRLVHRNVVSKWGIPSEIVVARPA